MLWSDNNKHIIFSGRIEHEHEHDHDERITIIIYDNVNDPFPPRITDTFSHYLLLSWRNHSIILLGLIVLINLII